MSSLTSKAKDGWARWKLAHFYMRDIQDVDVSTTLPVDGNALVYVGADKKWEPGAASTIENVNTVAASGATQTLPDVTTATMHHITLSANCTLTFPTPVAGASFTLKLIQDGTGSRLVTWPPSSVRRFVGGTTPTLSTAAAAIDVFSVVCDDATKWDIYFAGKGLA